LKNLHFLYLKKQNSNKYTNKQTNKQTPTRTMAIMQAKKEFVKKISQGIHSLMATTYTADDISIDPECEIEEYIKKHLLEHENSAIGEERAWFSEEKFDTFMDTESDELITELLCHINNLDITLWRSLDTASLHPRDLTEEETKWAEMIERDNMSFGDFLRM